MKRLLSAFPLALLLAASAPLWAKSDSSANEDQPDRAVPEEKAAVTHHSVTVDGETIQYTATAGTLHIQNDEGEPVASFFYVAYTKDGVDDPSRRPVTFFYNGGPGSSTVWLHMGSFAPVRVVTRGAKATTQPPYRIVPNHYSLIDLSDLVFIDAIGTGYSRIIGEGEPDDFYGVDQDISAFARFITRYVTVNGRWNSPKFLAGESYGTTRSAGLVQKLQSQGMDFNGVVLISSILNFYNVAGPRYANDLAYQLFLPTMAAVAWYHHALPERPDNLTDFLNEVRDFALGQYANALARGFRLSESEQRAVARKLHAYTGLDVDFILKADLRVAPGWFEKRVLEEGDVHVGRLDARFVGGDVRPVLPRPAYDPSSNAINGAFTAAFHHYIRRVLGFKTDLVYRTTNYDVVNKGWEWEHEGSALPNVAADLRKAMIKNPQLMVFAANGYYDLATPFFATEYTFAHMQLPERQRENIRFGYYKSGHMIYLKVPALKELKQDLAAFYKDATR